MISWRIGFVAAVAPQCIGVDALFSSRCILPANDSLVTILATTCRRYSTEMARIVPLLLNNDSYVFLRSQVRRHLTYLRRESRGDRKLFIAIAQ